jgi:hypothetical protein
MVFWPLTLRPHYRPLEFFEAGFWEYLPSLVFMVAMAVAFALSRKWALAGLLFFVPLIPVLNLVPIGEVLAERFLYLPLSGVGLALGLLVAIRLKGRGNLVLTGICGLWVMAMGFLTLGQVEAWTNSYTLWRHAVSIDPEDPQAHYGLGVAYLKKGVLKGEPSALSCFEKVQELNPRFKPDLVEHNLGKTRERSKDFEEALKHYEQSIKLNPYSSLALEALLDFYLNHVASGDFIPPQGNDSFAQEKLEAYLDQLYRITPDKAKRDEYKKKYGSLQPLQH